MTDDKCQVFKQRGRETEHSIKGHLKRVAHFKKCTFCLIENFQKFPFDLYFFIAQMNKYKIFFTSANSEVLPNGSVIANFMLLTFSPVGLFLFHKV